jgi:polysaccharide chain length determinant protein (PEP-CTERM system associated)
MQMPSQTIKLEYILETIIRRRWFIVLPFCVAILVGIYYALTLPKLYEASTMILVQSQRVPTSYVQSVVTTDIMSRLNTISQQILSRTNIERIINDYKLFSEPHHSGMYLEDKVQSVRNRIGVRVSNSSTFSITFKGTEPEKVKNIANALATYFIDENLKVREAQALGTSDFLDDELETMRQRLEESEQTLREYRQRYMGELPDQLTSNLSILQQYTEELTEKQKTLNETRAALASLQKQISEAEQLADAPLFSLDDSSLFDFDSGENPELSALRDKLAALKTRYKEQHPDVQRIIKMIQNLEAEEAAAMAESEAEELEDPEEIALEIPAFDYQALQKAQLEEINAQIKTLELEIEGSKKNIEIYRQRVENTPKREEELLSIRRDYNNLQSAYESLLNRRLEAEISVNMEKKQKGEQFQVVDPAKTPEKPISPNMPQLFIVTVFAGLAIGGGGVFVLEFLSATYRSEEDIEKALDVPIIAKVPTILDPKAKARKRLNFIFSIASIAFALFLLFGFSVITQKGADKTLAFIRNLI